MAVNAPLVRLAQGPRAPHALHAGDRPWLETNCYADLWIELLHTLGHEPLAMLAFTVGLDFEGDQWLFFKPPASDLYELYGIDVQELNIYRPLIAHVEEQLRRGRVVLAEVDAHYLPDTAGVSYRATHTKTTIAIVALDRETRRLRYFHNAGFFELTGDDFVGLFERAPGDEELPPYVEFVKLTGGAPPEGEDLREKSRALLARHVARAPRQNPVRAFQERFAGELTALAGGPEAAFHLYAFATLRQCGAGFGLAADYVRWLDPSALEQVATAFDTLAGEAKTLQFKAARAALLGRSVDVAPLFSTMESAWSAALAGLRAYVG